MTNLIIESGASKTDWLFYEDNQETSYQTIGYNLCSDPHTSELPLPDTSIDASRIKRIYFYGAGVNTQAIKDNIRKRLQNLFPNSEKVTIDTDLMATGRATSDQVISVISILGTGCNCALFDGKDIIKTVPSMGYLFSEPGSGFSIGQEVIKSYFYGYMPEIERERFASSYGSDLGVILSRIYQSDKPNYTIAKYAEFLHGTEPYYKDYILEKLFSAFMEEKVKHIQKANSFKLNFVGSIAYYYADVLSMVCKMHGYQVNKIIKNPIQELKKYHLKYDN